MKQVQLFFKQKRGYKAEACLEYKISKLMDNLEWQFDGEVLLATIHRISKIVPPCVVFCVVSAWCNGWATAARFQVKNSKCQAHVECEGKDDVRHYAKCPYLWNTFKACTGMYHIESSDRSFFLLSHPV